MLLVAAVLIVAVSLAHSILGEKYILMRLFRQPLPRLFGDDRFTKQTLRFVWHLTSVAWVGFAIQIALLHFGESSRAALLQVIATTFAITAIIAFGASRGKHLSWPVFTAISVICYVAA